MAEKIFSNVRLGLKVDTLENWNSSSLPLKRGEVAFATVAASAGTGLKEPVVMMKIGEDGVKTFKDLEWNFYAKASDVLAACKSEDALKTFISGVIADSGIATNDAMEALAGKVTTAEGKITTLEGKMTAVEGKASANETAIGALQGLVGSKEVSVQINEAIAALNLATTYEKAGEAAKVQTALNEYKTANDAAVQKNATDIAGEISRAKAAEEANTNAINAIKDGTTIDSFKDVEDALAGKETAGAAAQALADAKTYANGLAGNYDAAGSAATAESNAKAYAKEYADSLAENYDASGSAAQALVDAKAYTDEEIQEWVGPKTVSVQISEAITGLDLANTYAAKSHKHTKADITDFAHTHEMSEVNGLGDALAAKLDATTFEGYKTTNDAAVKANADAIEGINHETTGILAQAKAYANGLDTAMDARVDALEAKFGEGEGNVESQIAAAVAAEAKLREEADADLLELIESNDADILALQGLVGSETVAKQIEDAVKVESDRAKGIEGGLETRLKAVEDDYLTSVEEKALQDQITANANAIELLTNGVKADEVDGVNDLIQYVKEHGTEVTGIKADIKANADAIDAIEADYLKAADKTELQGNIDAVSGRVTTLETESAKHALKTEVEAVAGRVTTIEGDLNTAETGLKARMTAAEADIDALEAKVGDKTVGVQISEAIAAENLAQYAKGTDLEGAVNRIVELEKVDHEHANAEELAKFVDGDKAKLDTAVQTVTAGTGLKATKTGTEVAVDFDETITFVFDCGTSAI